jgi:hypothetical protein
MQKHENKVSAQINLIKLPANTVFEFELDHETDWLKEMLLEMNEHATDKKPDVYLKETHLHVYGEIEKKNKEHENYSIEIVDINGRKIIESDFDDNISTKVIDVSKINSGMYYVVLKNKMKTYSTKLIKE